MQRDPDPQLMRRAIALAAEGLRSRRGGPFGALIVRDGEVIATGENRVTSATDPTAHAEIVAIRAACKVLGSHELSGCEIYASSEPCPMCYAAIAWARLDRIWYGAEHEEAARVGFDDTFLYEELRRPRAERRVPMGQLLREESLEVLREWSEMNDRELY